MKHFMRELLMRKKKRKCMCCYRKKREELENKYKRTGKRSYVNMSQISEAKYYLESFDERPYVKARDCSQCQYNVKNNIRTDLGLPIRCDECKQNNIKWREQSSERYDKVIASPIGIFLDTMYDNNKCLEYYKLFSCESCITHKHLFKYNPGGFIHYQK